MFEKVRTYGRRQLTLVPVLSRSRALVLMPVALAVILTSGGCTKVENTSPPPAARSAFCPLSYSQMALPLATDNPPVVFNQTLYTKPDHAISVTLFSCDPDDLISNDGSTWTVDTGPSSGSLSAYSGTYPDGTTTYTPTPAFAGTDVFEYHSTDMTALSSGTGRITIVVTDLANIFPIANDGFLVMDEDTIGSGTLTGSDPDSDPFTFHLLTDGTMGTVSIADSSTGAYSYSAYADVHGTDQFTFRTFDGSAWSSSATVTVTINPVPDVFYVDASATGAGDGRSWANAFTHPQDAVDVSESGDQVWVAEGTYSPFSTTDPFSSVLTLTDGVQVYGGFEGDETSLDQRNWGAFVTVLDGDLNGNGHADSGDSIVVLFGATGSIVDGLTIRNAQGEYGLEVYEKSGFTLANCVVENGQGTGAVFFNSSGISVENCTFRNHGNPDTGVGGIYAYVVTDLHVRNTTFIDNSGSAAGAMAIAGGDNQIENCLFRDNSSGDTGAIRISSSFGTEVKNCVFVGNTSGPASGAIGNTNNSTPTIINSSFYHNYADSADVAIHNSGGSLSTVINSILWADAGMPVVGTATVSFSNVYSSAGTYPGTGNLNTDPAFASTFSLTLSAGSACIDAGTDASSFGVTTDIQGIPRPRSDGYDMGAHEWARSLWSRTFGGPDDDYPAAMEITADGGFVVASRVQSYDASRDEIVVGKHDANGNLEWQKSYGGSQVDQPADIHQTTDGGYVVAGGTQSFGVNGTDAWVLKLDTTGAVEWEKTYGVGTGVDTMYSVRETSDSGYILAGVTRSFGSGNEDIWVLKLTSDGTVQWHNAYGGFANDRADSAVEISPGNYIVVGRTQSFGQGGDDLWVVKLDASGSIDWQKTYGGTEFEVTNDLQPTSDGGFITAGWSSSFKPGQWEGWIVKFDSDGLISWQNTYGGTNQTIFNSIDQTDDGGYIAAAETFAFGAASADKWIVKLSSSGYIEWQKLYGTAVYDYPVAIKQAAGGHYLVAGRTGTTGSGDNDLWLLKLSPDGEIGGGCPYGVDTLAVPVTTGVAGTASSGSATAGSVDVVLSSATVAEVSMGQDTQCLTYWDCADVDDDGYSPEGGLCGPVDCDDTPGTGASVNPGMTEIEGNGRDDDCNPQTSDIAGQEPPVSSDDVYAIYEDASLANVSAGVLVNDYDPDGDSISAQLMADVSNGSLAFTQNGTFTYTPTADWFGTDQFTYRAYDGTAYSATTAVTLSVYAVNDAPVAQTDSIVTDEETAYAGTLVATDVDSGTLTFSIVTPPTKGAAIIEDVNTGEFTFLPNLDATGDDSFTFQANDGSEDSNLATVSIFIDPVNDQPVPSAGADQTGINEGTPVLFSGSFSDVDGTSPYTIEWDFADGNRVSGTLTPSNTYADNGTYTAVLTVTDSGIPAAAGSDTAVITVINVDPVAEAGPNRHSWTGSTVHFDASGSTDAGTADVLTYGWNFGDGNTASGISPSHAYTSEGSFTVTLTVTDDDGGSDTDTASVIITRPPVVWYVDLNSPAGPLGDGTSWDNAFLHPQQALDFAVYFDQIRVAAGSYVSPSASSSEPVIWMTPGAEVIGGYSGTTLEGGEVSGYDPGVNIVALDGEDSHWNVVRGATDATLSSLTVTRGFASKGAYSDTHNLIRGGGLYATGVTGLTIDNCTFEDNFAWMTGGAIYSYASSVRIVDSVIRNNSGGNAGNGGVGGAHFEDTLNAEVVNTIFDSNWARMNSAGLEIDGAGPSSSSSAVVDSCMFSRNLTESGGGGGMNANQMNDVDVISSVFDSNTSWGGGGLRSYNCANVTVDSCRFIDNWARDYGGGAEFAIGTVRIRNSIFKGNETGAWDGGGVHAGTGSNVYLVNDTFALNRAQNGGGAVRTSGGNAYIINSILWNNYAPTVQDNTRELSGIGVNFYISWSDVMMTSGGPWPGPGNINAAPAFAETVDFTLPAGSVCLNAGTDASAYGVTTDFNAYPRPMGLGWEMGAQEYFQGTWAKILGGSFNEYSTRIKQTAEGGFIVAGESYTYGSGNNDLWIFKLAPDGSVQWQRTFGGAGFENIGGIVQTADTGYVVTGMTTSSGSGGYDIWVLKLNSDGSTAWQTTYGGSMNDFGEDIVQTTDGGYAVAGISVTYGPGGNDLWLLKLDSAGGVEWQNTYGGTESDEIYSILQTSDGGFALAGHTQSFGEGGYDIWVLKLGTTGNVEWQKTYGGAGTDRAYRILQTADNGYVLVGETNSFGNLDYDIWLLKLDAGGSIDWQKSYGGAQNDTGRYVARTSDGGYIITGHTYSFTAGQTDFWMLKLDSEGLIEWQRSYGDTDFEYGYSAVQTYDGGYALTGWTRSFGAGQYDVAVFKLDTNGEMGDSCSLGTDTLGTAVISGVSSSNSTASLSTTSVYAAASTLSSGVSTAADETLCSGYTICTDGDGDGYYTGGGDCGPVDCDDTEFLVNPGMTEIEANSIDDDCNLETSDTIGQEPPVALADSYAIYEDVHLVDMSAGVLANDYDPDSDPMSASLLVDAANGSLSFGSDGLFSYQPDPDWFGTDQFIYRVYDGAAYSATTSVTITVYALNDAPVALMDSITTDEETAYAGTLVATDVDSGSLTYSIVYSGSKGAAVIDDAATGAYSYLPNLNANGADEFTFRAYDGNLYSYAATVYVTINPVNDPPEPSAGLDQTVDEGSPVLFSGSFSDVDGTGPYSYDWDFADGNTTSGSLTASNTYADNGTYVVVLTVTDNGAASGTDSLVVTVNNVDPVADAGPDQVTTVGGTVSFDGSGSTDVGTDDVLSYGWNFGNGNTASGISVSYAYTTAGVYTVTLTATDDDGGSDTDTASVTVSSNIWYVDQSATGASDGTSWTDAFLHPQDAMAVAGSNDQVWVAAGTYAPLSTADLTVPVLAMMDSILVYGGFAGTESTLSARDPVANVTILDADADSDLTGDVYHVVTGASNAVLDGFTITHGAYNGGGIYADSISNMEINNCIISDNEAGAGSGGGILSNTSTGLYLSNCKFNGNQGNYGGALGIYSGDIFIDECTFSGNNSGGLAWGGAIDSADANITIIDSMFVGNWSGEYGGAINQINSSVSNYLNLTGCEFIGNTSYERGGAIHFYRGSLSIDRCNFFNNRISYSGPASYGGAVHLYSENDANIDSKISNSMFASNETSYGNGGAIGHLSYAVSDIINCSFSRNRANNGSGASIYTEGSGSGTTRIVNSIFRDGTAGSAVNNTYEIGDGNTTVQYSNVAMTAGTITYTGTGNINTDPLFADSMLRLAYSSPCIDTGTDTSSDGVTVDYGGVSRPQPWDGQYDMGAWEFREESWVKSYGDTGNDFGMNAIRTSDGGYVLTGHTNSAGAGNYDLWVIKLDANGFPVWQKTYGGAGNEYGGTIVQTSDGGYAIGTDTTSFGQGGSDIWVLKLNQDGSVAWQYTYGGTGYDYGYSMTDTADGGYIVCGPTYSYGVSAGDLWVLKLDSAGAVSWQKTYGGTGFENCRSIQQTSDTGYIVSGRTKSFGAGLDDVWVLKLDSSGNVTWEKTYGGTSYDYNRQVLQTSDGGYITSGYTDSFGTGGNSIWIIKLNSDGTADWQNVYTTGSSDYGEGIKQTTDGGYAIAGYTYGGAGGGWDLCSLKLASDGTITWDYTFGGTGDDFGHSVDQASDGGFLFAGQTGSAGAGSTDVWVLKLTSSGDIEGSCDIGSGNLFTSSSTAISGSNSSATITTTSVSAVASTATVSDTNATVTTQCE